MPMETNSNIGLLSYKLTEFNRYSFIEAAARTSKATFSGQWVMACLLVITLGGNGR
jgi:hypothetical protein